MKTHATRRTNPRQARGRTFAWVAGICTALAIASAGRAGAESVVTDRAGRISAIRCEGEYVPIQVNVRIPLRGWGRQLGLEDATGVKVSREGARTTRQGVIRIEGEKRFGFEQVLEEAEGAVRLELKVTAEAEVEIEGVFLWLDVPIALFSGGEGALDDQGAPVARVTMPAEPPDHRHFLTGTGSRLLLAAPRDRARLEVALDRALPVTVQDSREWKGTVYSAFCRLAPTLAAGETTSLKATLTLAAQPDQRPAKLTLDPGRTRYRLHGFGGNYCFNIESPVTHYTLENLSVAWARTEMTPTEWEPRNDNDSPEETSWAALEAQDKPDSNLRREFLLAKEIQAKGIPYVISIWDLPEWLYAEPAATPRASRRRIHPDKWPELLECLSSYLEYARRKYGVEPDLFSFNEANIGVRVLLSAEEHREAIKRIGSHFRKLGLKTRMLLADATGPRGTHTYALPAANDPEAMQYVGAVGFHSWGGASAAEYAAWGDLAERLKLPLLVAELGVDAGAWRGRTYDSFHYALREVRMYQELLLHARPQGTMQWEFTSDYSIVAERKDANGKVSLEPTPRFHFVEHFCNLTPRNADALATTSDHPEVLLTAFAGEAGGRRVLTLHVANLAAGRKATLDGLPTGIGKLRAVRTSETEGFRDLEPVTPRGGKLELDLAPASLLTLTTMP